MWRSPVHSMDRRAPVGEDTYPSVGRQQHGNTGKTPNHAQTRQGARAGTERTIQFQAAILPSEFSLQCDFLHARDDFSEPISPAVLVR